MAERIQLRAIRRCGELLKAIESQQGKRTDKLSEGSLPKLTRTSAARDAAASC
jgi:hypothetical protein